MEVPALAGIELRNTATYGTVNVSPASAGIEYVASLAKGNCFRFPRTCGD